MYLEHGDRSVQGGARINRRGCPHHQPLMMNCWHSDMCAVLPVLQKEPRCSCGPGKGKCTQCSTANGQAAVPAPGSSTQQEGGSTITRRGLQPRFVLLASIVRYLQTDAALDGSAHHVVHGMSRGLGDRLTRCWVSGAQRLSLTARWVVLLPVHGGQRVLCSTAVPACTSAIPSHSYLHLPTECLCMLTITPSLLPPPCCACQLWGVYRLKQGASSSAASSSGGVSVAPKAWSDLMWVTLGEAQQALTSWETAEKLYFEVSYDRYEVDGAVVRCWGGGARCGLQHGSLRKVLTAVTIQGLYDKMSNNCTQSVCCCYRKRFRFY